MLTARKVLILLVALAGLVGLAFISPIKQDIAYHRFADSTPLFGVVNGWNVLSNIPFFLVGLWGMRLTRSGAVSFLNQVEAWTWWVLFLSITLVGFGSSYYHMMPVNETLVWDRLPMSLGFMALFSIILMDRVGPKTGAMLALPLMLAGVGSVLYWGWTEELGRGDLRPYIAVQFLPMLLMPVILGLLPGAYKTTPYLLMTLLLYVAAKGLELMDQQIYELTAEMISGHALKHLFAASACFCLLLHLIFRQSNTGSGFKDLGKKNVVCNGKTKF